MAATAIRFHGGDLGMEEMRVRCNLSEASSPVEVDYGNGDGWKPTQYQCADAKHRTWGLIAVGKQLAANAVDEHEDDFDCEAVEV